MILRQSILSKKDYIRQTKDSTRKEKNWPQEQIPFRQTKSPISSNIYLPGARPNLNVSTPHSPRALGHENR